MNVPTCSSVTAAIESGLKTESKTINFTTPAVSEWESYWQMLKLILETIPQPVFWKDRDFVFQGCNAVFSAEIGCSQYDIIGKTDFDICDETTAKQYRAEDEWVMHSGCALLDYEAIRVARSGEQKWESVSKLPLRDGTGNINGVLGISRDLTEQKYAGEALRASEERFVLFDCAYDAYFLLDHNGIFIDGNQAAEKLTGYHRLELFRNNFLDVNLLSTSDMRAMEKYLADVTQNKVVGPGEFTLTRRDGSKVDIEMRGFLVTIQGFPMVQAIARDTSELKEVESRHRP